MTFVEQCRALVAKWLGLLGLTTTVTVEVCGPDEMSTPNALAECYSQWQYDDALIRFVDPVKRGATYDIEAVVAHEVMHIPFGILETKPGTEERRLEERLVETLSKQWLRSLRGVVAPSRGVVAGFRVALGAAVARARVASGGRPRGAKGRARMMISKETAQAALDAIAAGDTGPALEVLQQILAEAITGGEDSGGESEPAEVPPMAADPAVGPEKDPHAPAMRAAVTTEQRLRLAAEKRARVAAEETARLAESGLKRAMFAADPAVFTADVQVELAGASPDEVRRFGAAAKKLRVAPPPPAARARVAHGEPKEPSPGGKQRGPNNGGYADAEEG